MRSMTRAHRGKDFIGWNSALRISFHRVIDRHDLFAKPALDGRIALLKSAQPRADDFAPGRVAAGRYLSIDKLRLLGREAECALGSRCHVLRPFSPSFAPGMKVSYQTQTVKGGEAPKPRG